LFIKFIYKIQVALKYDNNKCKFTLNNTKVHDYIWTKVLVTLNFQTEFVEKFEI